MSNFFTNNVDLSSNDIFQPLGQGTPLTYNTGYTLNEVDFRYIFLPYFISKANATSYLYQNNDLCNIFNKRLPFIIGSGISYIGAGGTGYVSVEGGGNFNYGAGFNPDQFPVGVNPNHRLLYITAGYGTLQIINSSSIVAMVLVGGGGGGGYSQTGPSSFSLRPGNGGQVRTITTGFSNTTYNISVGIGGVKNTVGGTTSMGGSFIPAFGGRSISSNNTNGNSGNGVLVSYNNLYYGGAGGGFSESENGYIGGGGGAGAYGVRVSSDGNYNGYSGGSGGGQKPNVSGGSGGSGGDSFSLSGRFGGVGPRGSGGGGGGSGYVTIPSNNNGTAYDGGGGASNRSLQNAPAFGYKFVRSYTPTLLYNYASGAGGGGDGGENSGGGGGRPGVTYYRHSSDTGYQPKFSEPGSGGSGIIIIVFT